MDIAVVIMGMDMFGSRVTKVLKFLAALKGIYIYIVVIHPHNEVYTKTGFGRHLTL